MSGMQTMLRRLRRHSVDTLWTPHALRRTFATSLLRAGADVFTLQMLGGWKDLEMPRHYSQSLRMEDAVKVHARTSPADQVAALEDDRQEEAPPKK